MNILDKCTLGFWKQNKVKLVSLIFCMILSAALLMSLLLTFGVFSDSLIASKKAIYGDYMAEISGISRNEAAELTFSDKVKSSFYAAPVGFAGYSSNDRIKRYIMVLDADGGFMENMPVHLLMGRLPENGSELLLPNHMGDRFALGDSVPLDLGVRMNDGGAVETYGQFTGNEYIADAQHREYTVVGFYEKAIFEDPVFPAYIAITGGGTADMDGSLYVTLRNPFQVGRFIDGCGHSGRANQELLSCYGVNLRYGQLDLAQLFMVIILLLIAVVMVMLFVLNRNIVTISLGDKRRKLWARLNGLGAVRRELYACAIHESAALTLIAAPFSIAAGLIGSRFILRRLSQMTSITVNGHGSVIFSAVFPILLVGIYVLAAELSFVRNVFAGSGHGELPKRYTPIDTSDITRNLAKKYISGSRRQKRSMITAVAVCLIMFVSFSSVCSDLNRKNELNESTIPSDIVFSYYEQQMNYADPVELYETLKSMDGVTESNLVYRLGSDDKSALLYAVDDEWFAANFGGTEPVFVDNSGDVSGDHVSGELTFTKFLTVGEVDNSVENVKFETEEREFTFPYSAVKVERGKFLGLYDTDSGFNAEEYAVALIYPYSEVMDFLSDSSTKAAKFYFNSGSADLTFTQMFRYFNKNGYSSKFLVSFHSILQEERNNYFLIRFFSSVFTVFIFIIAVFDLLNITLSNIRSRISDYVVLYSLGTNKRDIQRISLYEGIYCQLRGAIWAVIPTAAICFGGYRFISNGTAFPPHVPVNELMICLLVFMVIDLITVIMAVHLLEKDKIVSCLKDRSL